jgi:2-dehydro-3-deoxyphosphogluconate aldolase / (4S)-4-hydroxy-2-oxoglutarate aldolase
MPTGGVNLKNIKDYFYAGAVAGGGSSLVNPAKLNSERDYADLTKKVRQYSSENITEIFLIHR